MCAPGSMKYSASGGAPSAATSRFAARRAQCRRSKGSMKSSSVPSARMTAVVRLPGTGPRGGTRRTADHRLAVRDQGVAEVVLLGELPVVVGGSTEQPATFQPAASNCGRRRSKFSPSRVQPPVPAFG